MKRKVRVRFAPSPTGPLHIGGVRTALYNYFFAKKNNGDFILRIEDTDQTRFVANAEKYITKSLKWCGITLDESPELGGEYGPYRQSERKDIYKKYADELLDTGNAYIAFDTPEELDALRNKYEAEKKTFTYNSAVRGELQNSIALSPAEVKTRIEAGEAYVLRHKMPENYELVMQDIIRGTVKVNTSALDDKIIFKSDGMPTYHLANIVDDYLMKISHVIRGEEWLPSLPLHVMLYKALGWENTMPEFAHLPLLLKPTGKGKLSKRDGDKLGFPVFPLEWKGNDGNISKGYRESGYFPEAFVNLLSLLGWNAGTEQEIFSIPELIQEFSLEKVGKSGSRFDLDKAKWFNNQWLQQKSNDELALLFLPVLKEKNINTDQTTVSKIISLVKDRASFVNELWDQSSFFFVPPTEYDAKFVKKRWKEGSPSLMTQLVEVIENIELFSSEETEAKVKKWIEKEELGMGAIMNAFRLCVVGAGKGPHMFDIIEVLGKQETISRIKSGIENIKK